MGRGEGVAAALPDDALKIVMQDGQGRQGCGHEGHQPATHGALICSFRNRIRRYHASQNLRPRLSPAQPDLQGW